MKDKVMDALQRFSKAMFIPVLILPIAGILIAVGNLFTNPRLQAVLPQAQLGRVTGCTMALASLTQPVGQAVYGVLFDVFSACPAGVLLGAGAVSAVFLTGAMRHETEKRSG